MPILNYTTTVAVDRSIEQIRRILRQHGARGMSERWHADGTIAGITFTLTTEWGDQEFELPGRVDRVFKVMQRQYHAGKLQPRFANKEQAARVAWRITKDWIESQCALIEADMANVSEILFPYALNGADGRTFFDVYRDHQLSLPAAGETYDGDRQ